MKPFPLLLTFAALSFLSLSVAGQTPSGLAGEPAPQTDSPTQEEQIASALDTGIEAFIARDFAAAKVALELPLKKRDVSASYLMGLMHMYGLGGPVNAKEALPLLIRSAKGRCPQAMRTLARRGMDTGDMPTFAKWIRQAAEMGDAQSMYITAGSYSHGRGVRADPLLALAWATLASESGYQAAKAQLSTLVEQVKQSPVASLDALPATLTQLRSEIRKAKSRGVVSLDLPLEQILGDSSQSSADGEPIAGEWSGFELNQETDSLNKEIALQLSIRSLRPNQFAVQIKSSYPMQAESGREVRVDVTGELHGNVGTDGKGELVLKPGPLRQHCAELNQTLNELQFAGYIIPGPEGTLYASIGTEHSNPWFFELQRSNGPVQPPVGEVEDNESENTPAPSNGPADLDQNPVEQDEPSSEGGLVFTDVAGNTPVTIPNTGGPAVVPSRFIAHLPEASNTLAPNWVRPGARITMWMGSATMMGSGNMTTMVPDPNGNLETADGKKWRRSTAGGGSHGNAGTGFMQIDVIHVSHTEVIYDIRTYVGDGTNASPAVVAVTSQIVHPGSCEFWIHPSLLASVQPKVDGDFRILKGIWEVQGKTYNAVIFQDTTPGSNGHVVYDLETGIALGVSQRAEHQSQHTQLDPTTGQYRPGTSNNTTMIETSLRGLRPVHLPWATMPLPPNALAIPDGTFHGQMGMEPSHGMPGTPMSDTLVVDRRHNGWMEASVTRTMQGAVMGPIVLKRVIAGCQLGGYAMHPDALRSLQQGQVIDQDRITGIKTYVEYAGLSNQGRSIVGIAEEGRGSTLRWIYDVESGHLFSYGVVLPMAGGAGQSVIHMERR